MKYLKNNAIRFERIDGECPLRRRQKILDDFSKSPDIPVLIMTTGTGAFGYEFCIAFLFIVLLT
jgi:SWI/SNF-related matrix-associated actin-dependent regulator of chromatin subfamily A3